MSVVLIADSNIERAHALADACQRVGLRARTASHGASALELALGEQPAALVTEVALPLIDGVRLAEILDANPHTRGMGVLYVGERPGSPADAEVQVLPDAMAPETIVHFLQALIARRGSPPHDEASAEGGVQGQLSQIALPELLDLFHVNRHSGVVALRQTAGRHRQSGEVWIRDGEVIHAEAGPVEAEKALYRLLAWRRGDFLFRPEVHFEKTTIERPTRALLREAARQMEECERLVDALPGAEAPLCLQVSRASLPKRLHPLTDEVLHSLEQADRVQEVLDRCRFPDYQVLRTLQTLSRRGMLRIGEGSATTARGELDADPGLAARLRAWLDARRPANAPPADAKLVFVGGSPSSRTTLAGLLEGMTGVEVSGGAPQGSVSPLAHISLAEETGIELLELASDPGQTASWHFVLHDALAVVLVNAPEDRPRALRPALDLLAQRPRTRVLHLLLQEKDGLGPQALAEDLGLLDASAVVCMPLERPAEAKQALYELLSRAVP